MGENETTILEVAILSTTGEHTYYFPIEGNEDEANQLVLEKLTELLPNFEKKGKALAFFPATQLAFFPQRTHKGMPDVTLQSRWLGWWSLRGPELRKELCETYGVVLLDYGQDRYWKRYTERKPMPQEWCDGQQVEEVEALQTTGIGRFLAKYNSATEEEVVDYGEAHWIEDCPTTPEGAALRARYVEFTGMDVLNNE